MEILINNEIASYDISSIEVLGKYNKIILEQINIKDIISDTPQME